MEKNFREKGFVSYLTTGDEAGKNISWGSILAGLVSFFAIFFTLSLIGSAIGFGIGDSVDREAIANAVSKNTELSKEEASQATDNIYNELKTASEQAQEQIETAQTNLEAAKNDLDKTIKEARQKAEDASNTVAKASVWGFVAMILGMLITSLAGMWGSKLVNNPETESSLEQ